MSPSGRVSNQGAIPELISGRVQKKKGELFSLNAVFALW